MWGGNLELQALSMAFRVHITIHQLDAPRFEIRNEFFDHDAKAIAAVRMVHLRCARIDEKNMPV